MLLNACIAKEIIASSFTSNGFQINFSVDSDWGTGCTAKVTVKNIGTTQTQAWVVDFDLASADQSVDNVWNGIKDPVISKGTHLRVSNPDWYHAGYLDPQASTSFGMNINKSGSTAGIKNVSCATSASATPTPIIATPSTSIPPVVTPTPVIIAPVIPVTPAPAPVIAPSTPVIPTPSSAPTNIQILAMTPAALAAIPAAQLSVLTPENIAQLSLNQVQALTISQLTTLSNTQLAALTAAQAHVLSAAQIAALSATQKAQLIMNRPIATPVAAPVVTPKTVVTPTPVTPVLTPVTPVAPVIPAPIINPVVTPVNSPVSGVINPTDVANYTALVTKTWTALQKLETKYVGTAAEGLLVDDQGDKLHSEGVGYGMIIAIGNNDKATFLKNVIFMAARLDKYGLMNWNVNTNGTIVPSYDGHYAASDADQDIMFALIQGLKKWPEIGAQQINAIMIGFDDSNATEMAPISKTISILDLAKQQLYSIWDLEVNHTNDSTNNLILPGDGFGPRPFGNASYCKANVSYFRPTYMGAYQEFFTTYLATSTAIPPLFNSSAYKSGSFTYNTQKQDWNAVKQVMYDYTIKTMGLTSLGLPPAWSDPITGVLGGMTGDFQYDAVRVLQFIAMDYQLTGNAQAKQILKQILGYYSYLFKQGAQGTTFPQPPFPVTLTAGSPANQPWITEIVTPPANLMYRNTTGALICNPANPMIAASLMIAAHAMGSAYYSLEKTCYDYLMSPTDGGVTNIPYFAGSLTVLAAQFLNGTFPGSTASAANTTTPVQNPVVNSTTTQTITTTPVAPVIPAPVINPVVTPTTPVTPVIAPTPTLAPTSAKSGMFTIKYETTENWNNGYQGSITITNTSSTDVFGWTLEFDFLSNEQLITSLWGGIKNAASIAGHAKITNPENAKIGAGASINVGIIVSKTTSSSAGIKNATCSSTPSSVIALGEKYAFVAPTNSTPITAGKYKVIGYFPNWLIYPRANNTTFPKQHENRPLFNPLAIDVVTSQLTHVYFAFAKPYTLNADPDPLANMDPSQDKFCNTAFNTAYWNSGIKNYKVSIVDPWCDTCIAMKYADNFGTAPAVDPYQGNTYIGHLAALRAVKAKFPGLKTILSIGGWTIYNQGTPAAKYSALIANATSRNDFITSAIELTQKYGFDGLDIDFEYPAYVDNGGAPADTANYTIFLSEFRTALNNWNAANPTKQLTLSLAAPAGITNMKNIELNKIHPYVDWINLMTYDFNGDWASTTGHNAPLTAPVYNGQSFGDGIDKALPGPTFYTDYAVQYYLKQGVPANKLVLGMPLYGRSFANAAPTETVPGYPGLYNTFDHTISGSQVTDDGHSYQSWPNVKNNILPNLATNGYKRYWDTQAQVPYLFNANYSNPNIPTAKTDLITYDDDQSLGIKAEYVKTNKLGGAMFWQLENDAAIWSAIGNVGTILSK
jgi:chitinase